MIVIIFDPWVLIDRAVLKIEYWSWRECILCWSFQHCCGRHAVCSTAAGREFLRHQLSSCRADYFEHNVATDEDESKAGLPADLLRVFFHDCFVRVSILDSDYICISGSLVGPEIYETVQSDLETWNPDQKLVYHSLAKAIKRYIDRT